MDTNSHLNPSKYIFNLSDKSCLECVKEFIEKINKKKDLNIFIEVFEKESLSTKVGIIETRLAFPHLSPKPLIVP